MDTAIVSALIQYEDTQISRRQLSNGVREFNDFEMGIRARKKLILNNLSELKRFATFMKDNNYLYKQ